MSAPLDFEEALQRLLQHAAPLNAVETVSLWDADGRVLAEPLVSAMDVPGWDNSQMDGYAVRAAELAAGGSFAVSQRIPAGHPGQPLQPGTVARIFTGAAMPAGADAVVMQEDAQTDDEGRVRFGVQPQPGAWVRRQGEDIARGSVALAAGTRLTPAALGLAASIGVDSLPVHRRPRVAVFFTGDELVMPGQPLPPGAIYNSNRFVLRALLQRLGCEVQDLGIVPDNLEATRAALRRAVASADLVITAGGISVGEEDHVRPAVQAEGELDLWRIAIKPGKPLAYGRIHRSPSCESVSDCVPASGMPQQHGVAGNNGLPTDAFAHFIGLPGNPVSSFVTFLMLVRPFLLRLQGAVGHLPRAVSMIADFDWPRPDTKRREFLRAVQLPDGRHLDLFRNQGSGVLTSAAVGDGLIDNPPGNVIRRGDVVRFIPFSELLN
ncbi:MAG: molybdopterin molybdotransferase MoeA [Lautropia sp.]|nr:molybdopterin molybdotransferase MoeA [Lautropia sp.]